MNNPSLKDIITELDVRYRQAEKKLSEANDKVSEAEESLMVKTEAHEIINAVVNQTQEKFQYNIFELSSLAMAGIFDDPYQVKLDFSTKYGSGSMKVLFIRDGEELDPMKSCGGGTLNIAALALRASMLSMAGSVENVLVFDEPMKDINDPERILHSRVGSTLKEICSQLGIQIIMVSLIQEIVEHADNVIDMNERKDTLYVKERKLKRK